MRRHRRLRREHGGNLTGRTALCVGAWLAVLVSCLPIASVTYAFNTQNPRWEVPGHGTPQQGQKPYKPLRQPPGAFPERGHRGVIGNATPSERVTAGVVAIVLVGAAISWLTGALGIAPTLVLIVLGGLAGPVAGLLDPDAFFGHLLVPLLTMAVTAIVFVEALAIGSGEPALGGVIERLVVSGALLTGCAGALAAYAMLDFSIPLALLMGAILIIAGHTGGAVSASRRRASFDQLVAQEARALDLIGTLLVALLLRAALTAEVTRFLGPAMMSALRTLVAGLLSGAVGSAGLLVVFHQRWIPRRYQLMVALTAAVAVCALSNLAQRDSGLVAAMLMGLLLSSQGAIARPRVRALESGLHAVLGSSALLIVAARLRRADFAEVDLAAVGFATIVLLARPLAVLLSTWRSPLDWGRRRFLAVSAPRGFLSAGLCTLCAVALTDAGDEQAAAILPLTMLVIAISAILNLSAIRLANRVRAAEDANASENASAPENTGEDWARVVPSA